MRKNIGRAVIVSGVLFCGCTDVDDGEASVGEAVRYDSAGVTIVDNGRLDPASDLLAAREPLVEIGVIDGPPEYQFFRIVDIERLSDGAVAVANAGTDELRIYEPDGTHRVTAGGPGEGPGEFRSSMRALRVLPGDTIEVHDFMDRVYFSPDGSFMRRETGDRPALATAAQAVGGGSEGGQWLPDGSFFAPVFHWEPSRGPPEPGPLYRPRMTFVRISADFAEIDTLGAYGGILQQFRDMGGARGVSSIVPPYATSTRWALGTADGTIVVSDNDRPEVHRFHPDGSRSIIRWTADARPITDADVEAWKDRQREASWTQGQLPELERGWASMDIPDARAYYGMAIAGSDGRVWVTPVEDYLQTSTVLRAFDPDGSYAGSVEVPGWFTPHDSGPGWLIGVVRGDADIERVQVYELKG